MGILVMLPQTFVWKSEVGVVQKPLRGEDLFRIATATLGEESILGQALVWAEAHGGQGRVFFAFQSGGWLFTPFDGGTPWSLEHSGRQLQWLAFAHPNQHRSDLQASVRVFTYFSYRLWETVVRHLNKK
ncbi:MAG TPA: hypothetical protein VFT87_03395 [Candidatus Saccharimonadales bacterium]|nr:hypothetical protein [Candidatus Saccharimonadales bacterium]